MKQLLKNLLIHGRKTKGYCGQKPSSLWLKVTALPILLGVSSAVSYGQSTQTEPNCSHDKIICAWKDRVVGIKTPTMIADPFGEHDLERSKVIIKRVRNNRKRSEHAPKRFQDDAK